MTDRPIRAYALIPVYDPPPGTLCNSGTTFCLATGTLLLGTDIGTPALSPAFVAKLREKALKVRVVFEPLIASAVPPVMPPNELRFLEVQDVHTQPIAEDHPALEWLADGDHEAVVIDLTKL